MRKLLIVVVSASLVMSVLSLKAQADNDKLSKSLIGKWKLVSAEIDKGRISQDDIDDAKIYLKIDDMTIAFYERGMKKKVLKYKIKTENKPFELELIYDDNKINYAIFIVTKDTLTICSSNDYKPNAPEDRPDGFTVTSKKNANLGGLNLEVYSLEK